MDSLRLTSPGALIARYVNVSHSRCLDSVADCCLVCSALARPSGIRRRWQLRTTRACFLIHCASSSVDFSLSSSKSTRTSRAFALSRSKRVRPSRPFGVVRAFADHLGERRAAERCCGIRVSCPGGGSHASARGRRCAYAHDPHWSSGDGEVCRTSFRSPGSRGCPDANRF